MPLPTPEIGLVIGYSYLWKSEAEQGQTEGVKTRPCAIILTVQTKEKDQLVTLVPITHTPPHTPDDAIEIPHNTKRRLGLDGERSWVVISEVNRFFWPGPDLRPINRDQPDTFVYGSLPPSLFRTIRDKLIAHARLQSLETVTRD
jgi:hypothetical protein